MRGTLVLMFQALIWPAVSALFTVEVEKSSYEAQLHADIKLVCTFSKVKNLSDLLIIWKRIKPGPEVEVYRYERGREKPNYTSVVFRERAQMIHQQLNQSRAVLHLKKLRIKDSGTYRCIITEGDELDYKQITLNVTALHTPIKKSVMKTDDGVELSCEFEGYPLPQVQWSDGQNINLTEKSINSTRSTEEDLFIVISRLTVRRDLMRNYTCSFITEGEVRQTATFRIPSDIPSDSSHQYVWIGSVVVVVLVIIFISIIHRKRKDGQKDERRNKAAKCSSLIQQTPVNTDSLLTVNENRPQTHDITQEEDAEKLQILRDALIQLYSRPIADTEMRNRLLSYCNNTLTHALQIRGGQTVNISSILPDKQQTVLLLGNPGSGKTTLAQILSSCWAQSLSTDLWNLQQHQLLMLVNCEEAEGEFFQVVRSNVPDETPLDVSDIRDILMGTADCLVILDGYREGNRDLDETLWMFLKERQTCRMMVMSRPGECPVMEDKVRTVLNLISNSDDSETGILVGERDMDKQTILLQ